MKATMATIEISLSDRLFASSRSLVIRIGKGPDVQRTAPPIKQIHHKTLTPFLQSFKHDC